MRLAFSTLGCPDWKFSEIFSTAVDLRFDGIEIRGVANELYVPKIRAFDSDHINKNMAKLTSANIEIPILTSGISLADATENTMNEAKEYIDFASKLHSKYIRIMISSKPQPEDVDIKKAIELYDEICKYAEDKKIIPLIETNGILADSFKMKEFLSAVESENKGVLWDIHHPFRFFNETPLKTYENIGSYIKYVHIKDSVMKDEKIVYRMMGYGDIPVFDCLKTLKENGYDGYISLEWVKRWNPDLEEPGIVFAHFMSYITFLLARL